MNLKIIFFIYYCVALKSVEGFQCSNTNKLLSFKQRPTPLKGTYMVLPGLAKKAKEAEVQLRRQAAEADPNNPVLKRLAILDTVQAASQKKPYRVMEALKKPKGTLTLVAEYRRKMKSGFIKEMLEPVFLSRVFRMAGAKVAAVYTDPNIGGCTLQDLKEIVEEQASSKGEYPGPLPVVAHDLIVSEFQLAEIAEAGASGCTISLSLNGKERTKELSEAASKLGLEVIVQVNNEEEIKEAVEMGAEMIGIKALTERLVELYSHIPAFLDRYSDEGLAEVEDAWNLRTLGYSTVWVGDVIYKGGMDLHEGTKALIKALIAKSSVTWGRAKGKSGKGEGAKEYLGTILM